MLAVPLSDDASAPAEAENAGERAQTRPSIQMVPWHDPVVDLIGHDARSTYVERFWLGVLGPSATWLLRITAYGFEHQPEGFELECAAAVTAGARRCRSRRVRLRARSA